MSCEDVLSLTVMIESIIPTSEIEADEEQDGATCDIPNSLVQTDVKNVDKDSNQQIMKIRGVLVDILCKTKPHYQEYVVIKEKQKVLYMHIMKAIYGLLVSAMIFYKKPVKDLKQYGFVVNLYNL